MNIYEDAIESYQSEPHRGKSGIAAFLNSDPPLVLNYAGIEN
jgi:hypothetical protein